MRYYEVTVEEAILGGDVFKKETHKFKTRDSAESFRRGEAVKSSPYYRVSEVKIVEMRFDDDAPEMDRYFRGF